MRGQLYLSTFGANRLHQQILVIAPLTTRSGVFDRTHCLHLSTMNDWSAECVSLERPLQGKLDAATRRDGTRGFAKTRCFEEADGHAKVGSVDEVEDLGAEYQTPIFTDSEGLD